MKNTILILAIIAVLYFLFKDKLNPKADEKSEGGGGGGGGGESGDQRNREYPTGVFLGQRQKPADTVQKQQSQVKKAQQLAAPKKAVGGNKRKGGLGTA